MFFERIFEPGAAKVGHCRFLGCGHLFEFAVGVVGQEDDEAANFFGGFFSGGILIRKLDGRALFDVRLDVGGLFGFGSAQVKSYFSHCATP